MMNSQLNPELVSQVALVGEQRTRVRDLTGFRKGHQVPSESNEHTRSFVARIAGPDIGTDLEEHYAAFRKHLNFRRVDLVVNEPENGIGRISTPWFDYQITVTQSVDDCAQIVWHRRVSDFRAPARLLSPEFASVFGKGFNTVELQPMMPIDVTTLIDSIEERKDANVAIDFDRNATWCTVEIRDIPAHMRVTTDLIAFVASQPLMPARLLDAFLQLRRHLHSLENRPPGK